MNTSHELALENTLKELIHNSQRIHGQDITVSVHDHFVTLSGTVESEYERHYVEEILHDVEGVGDIHMDVKVRN